MRHEHESRNASTETFAHRIGLISLLLTVICCSLFGDISLHGVVSFAYFFSHAGNTAFVTVGIALLLIDAIYRRLWTEFWFTLIAAAIVESLIHGLKFTVGSWLPRPSGSPGGFPSGHAMMAFALAYLLSRRFPRLAVLWYASAVVISWSRVELRRHYEYQVILGALIGLEAVAFALRRYEKTISGAAPDTTPKPTE
jgi:membrane-associated phospholipid phosphatase